MFVRLWSTFYMPVFLCRIWCGESCLYVSRFPRAEVDWGEPDLHVLHPSLLLLWNARTRLTGWWSGLCIWLEFISNKGSRISFWHSLTGSKSWRRWQAWERFWEVLQRSSQSPTSIYEIMAEKIEREIPQILTRSRFHITPITVLLRPPSKRRTLHGCPRLFGLNERTNQNVCIPRQPSTESWEIPRS